MARPIMVAIGGDSGTGKTTLGRGLAAVLGGRRVLQICLDDYHALDREQRRAARLTALDPRANDFDAMERDLRALSLGHAVTKPVYDHAHGAFAPREVVRPREIVIVEGLFPLYTHALRALFDLAVWLDPPAEVQVAWKLRRDTVQRGYSAADVIAAIEQRRPDAEAHVRPQARHAGVHVQFAGSDAVHAQSVLALAQQQIAAEVRALRAGFAAPVAA